MEKKPLSSYSLAIMPDATASAQVTALKLRLKSAIGRSYGSVNAAPHISLDGFDADEENYRAVLSEYRRILSGLSPFRIMFSGYGHFDNYYPSFYVRLTEDSMATVRLYYSQVRKEFNKQVRKQYMVKWQDESKMPHMTIGRRLTREWIDLAYSLFPEFSCSFECKAFSIRKYNEKARQYEVVDTLPLSGQAAPDGMSQLALF